MDLARYNSLNEKLRLCYNCLKDDDLTEDERIEIEEEAQEYQEEMDLLLKGV